MGLWKKGAGVGDGERKRGEAIRGEERRERGFNPISSFTLIYSGRMSQMEEDRAQKSQDGTFHSINSRLDFSEKSYLYSFWCSLVCAMDTACFGLGKVRRVSQEF